MGRSLFSEQTIILCNGYTNSRSRRGKLPAGWKYYLSLTTKWCTVQVSDTQMLMHYHVAGAASVDWRRRKRTKPYPVMLYHTSCYQLGLKRRLRLNRVLTLTYIR
jgi:hypothetical protein